MELYQLIAALTSDGVFDHPWRWWSDAIHRSIRQADPDRRRVRREHATRQGALETARPPSPAPRAETSDDAAFHYEAA